MPAGWRRGSGANHSGAKAPPSLALALGAVHRPLEAVVVTEAGVAVLVALRTATRLLGERFEGRDGAGVGVLGGPLDGFGELAAAVACRKFDGRAQLLACTAAQHHELLLQELG